MLSSNISPQIDTLYTVATPEVLPGKSHGRRILVGSSPWGRYKSDTTERLHLHFSLSHIAEWNGNSLQCSCLENPRDGLPSMGSHRVGHTWSDLAAAAAAHRSSSGKEPACQYRRCKKHGFNSSLRKIPWRRAQQPTPVFLPAESRE